MAHMIYLVVQSAPKASPATSATESPLATATAKSVKKIKAHTQDATQVADTGAIKVLIQQFNSLGRRECLIGGFMGVVEKVVAGVGSGQEELMRGESKYGKVPFWDV